MVTLQYFNGNEWVDCGDFPAEFSAWVSLGQDDFGYRTVEKETGNVLTDKTKIMSYRSEFL